MKSVIKVAGIALLFLGLAHTAEAQTGPWSTQGASNCSDQYGSFDAFIPGMRGVSACNRGGFVPGTNVIVVTNRNATGSGSLDAALNAGCPKVILFNVGGLIVRNGRTQTANCNNWSLVGASAPGSIVFGGSDSGPLINPKGNNWTIDHMIFAAGDWISGPTSNRDSTNVGNLPSDQNQGDAILLNNTFIWGYDGTLDCVPNANTGSGPSGGFKRVTYWQNIIGIGLGIGYSGGVMTSVPYCSDQSLIRNVYAHSNERAPNIRADAWFLSNNLHANVNRRIVQISPCNESGYTYDNPNRTVAIHNVNVKSQTSNAGQRYLENPGGTGCTTFQVYEEGNRVREDNGTIYNCNNHSCSGNIDSFNSNVWQSSPITALYPTGYVPETIASTQQAIENFATQILSHAGARPTNRLPYIQTRVINEVAGMADGSDTSSTFGETNNPPQGRWSSTALEGGVGQITPSNTSWTATNQCGGMPTGAAADSIQSSGLTGLHEWVIGCFYDNVMPAGYREDKLQNYPAPGGGGSGSPPPPPPPPPTTPNPPEWG